MTILTWQLSNAPAQPPEYWLLFVDGDAWCALGNVAPYVGAGQYSADLTQIDTPITPGPHQLSVALVGDGAVGPQSAAVSATIPVPVTVVTTQQPPVPPVWPEAVSVAAS